MHIYIYMYVYVCKYVYIYVIMFSVLVRLIAFQPLLWLLALPCAFPPCLTPSSLCPKYIKFEACLAQCRKYCADDEWMGVWAWVWAWLWVWVWVWVWVRLSLSLLRLLWVWVGP